MSPWISIPGQADSGDSSARLSLRKLINIATLGTFCEDGDNALDEARSPYRAHLWHLLIQIRLAVSAGKDKNEEINTGGLRELLSACLQYARPIALPLTAAQNTRLDPLQLLSRYQQYEQQIRHEIALP